VGPWVHTDRPKQGYGVLDFGVDSIIDLYALYLRWMDRWLKGIENGVENEPPLRLFMMGKNIWRTADKWPLPETQWTPFYLRSGGRANSLFGDGTLATGMPGGGEPADRYTYNPEDPVPTLGMDPNGEVAPLDHRPVEYRDDVLVYSTEALEEELEVTGPIQASVYASSSALDTDWTVKLLDVYPDGKAVNLWDGILRARYRDPAAIRAGVPSPGQFENPELLEPGKIYRFFIEVGVVSNVFLKGHKIRVEVSSSNFPRFDRNLNNGGKLGVDTEIVAADQTVYHDAGRPSHILLPVIPG
jgi:putative CocE/NonD family hydrolase